MRWPHPLDSPSSLGRSPAQARDKPDPPIIDASRTLAPSPSFGRYNPSTPLGPPPPPPSFSLLNSPPGCRNPSSELRASASISHRFRRDPGTPPPLFDTNALLMSVHTSPTSSSIFFCSRSSTAMTPEAHWRCLVSSRASSPLQDEIDVPDHTLESPSSRRTLSSTPSSLGNTRMPSTTTSVPHIAGDHHRNPNPR
jgi:hypothetical protein